MKAFLTSKILGLPMWLLVLVFAGGAAGAIAYTLNAPQHASWRYGACKAFLEQYVRFPTTIEIEQGGETTGSAYISFSDTNPFGSQQVRVFECYYTQDAQGRAALTRVTIDRKAIPADLTKSFNDQLPILGTQKLDTALPKDLPSSLEDYKN
jgi:hypothetical protein